MWHPILFFDELFVNECFQQPIKPISASKYQRRGAHPKLTRVLCDRSQGQETDYKVVDGRL
jgi:hypothetical protein